MGGWVAVGVRVGDRDGVRVGPSWLPSLLTSKPLKRRRKSCVPLMPSLAAWLGLGFGFQFGFRFGFGLGFRFRFGFGFRFRFGFGFGLELGSGSGFGFAERGRLEDLVELALRDGAAAVAVCGAERLH